MPSFSEFLRQYNHVPDKFIPHYLRWVDKYLAYRKPGGSPTDEAAAMNSFLSGLQDHFEEWQIRQARRSLLLHYSYQEHFERRPSGIRHLDRQVPATKADTLQRLTERIRVRHLAIRTEQTYRGWVTRFLSFVGIDKPSLINGKASPGLPFAPGG